jgi:hypothetical protein
MDHVTGLLQAIAAIYPSFGPYVGATLTVVTSLVAIASALATVSPAPVKTSGFYPTLYAIVNKAALAFGHAQSLTAPASTGIVGGPAAVAPVAPTETVPSHLVKAASEFPPGTQVVAVEPIAPVAPVLPTFRVAVPASIPATV